MSGPAVIAKITALPGKRDEVLAALQTIVAAVEDEPGTLVYVIHTDKTDADVVWFYEQYDSDDSFAAHSTSDTMKAVGMGLRDLAAARPELTFLEIVGGKGL